ncbi:hypothetical protein [Duncaniella dubosii]|uniref:hypothetical protein n=1 Tax=Duncaniella dubosii TaxID=2518971 RepID=UPI003F672CEF
MDALTHAIEGTSPRSVGSSATCLKFEAMYDKAAISRHCSRAFQTRLHAMQWLLHNMLPGMHFLKRRSRPCPRMAHPLGSLFDISPRLCQTHSCSPHQEWNMPACLDKYPAIAEAYGLSTHRHEPAEEAGTGLHARSGSPLSIQGRHSAASVRKSASKGFDIR